MKKYIPLLLCILLLASCTGASEKRSRVLKVYNWADYIDEEVLAEFPAWYKEQTGEDIRIIYQVFDINEIMLTKIERGQEDFDLVCPSEYIIERMLKKNLLLPIDRNFGKTPDYLPNISPYIRRELNKTSQPGRTTTDSEQQVGHSREIPFPQNPNARIRAERKLLQGNRCLHQKELQDAERHQILFHHVSGIQQRPVLPARQPDAMEIPLLHASEETVIFADTEDHP